MPYNPALVRTMNEMGAKVPVALTPDYFFDYGAPFVNLGAGQTTTIAVRIDSNVYFICEQMIAGAQLVNALGSAVAGTPLPRNAATDTTTGNAMPSMAHLAVSINTTDRPWSNLPTGVRLDLLSGTGPEGAWLPFKASVAGGDTINVTITNNSAVALSGQVIFRGHKLPVNAG